MKQLHTLAHVYTRVEQERDRIRTWQSNNPQENMSEYSRPRDWSDAIRTACADCDSRLLERALRMTPGLDPSRIDTDWIDSKGGTEH
jgi:hypothetical protein